MQIKCSKCQKENWVSASYQRCTRCGAEVVNKPAVRKPRAKPKDKQVPSDEKPEVKASVMMVKCQFCTQFTKWIPDGPLQECSHCGKNLYYFVVPEKPQEKPAAEKPVQQEEELNSKSVFLGIVVILVMVALIQPGCSYWEWIKYDGMSGPAPKCWWQEGYEEDSKRRRKRYIEEYEREVCYCNR